MAVEITVVPELARTDPEAVDVTAYVRVVWS